MLTLKEGKSIAKKKKIKGSCGEIRMDFLSLSAIFPFC